jgi:pyruvate dehydrogenase E2 component (dihydrolipoamide acetyltransferase)
MSKIIMPKAGQTMEEGTILRWHKQEGDAVTRGEVLLEIDSDKATVEVEASESGFLRKILCPEGVTVPVLAPIAIISGADEDVRGVIEAAEAELNAAMGRAPAAGGLPAVETAASDAGPGVLAAAGAPGAIKASPAARKIGRELGIDLGGIGTGSGPQGRILSTDVIRSADTIHAVPGLLPADGLRPRPLVGMRKAIAHAMVAAKQAIPHFYMKLTIDAGPLFDFYRKEKASCACTINDIVTLACARVIKEFPAFRSRIEGDGVIEYPAASIGVAVGLDEGLVVPVVAGADSMSLRELAAETERIVEAARHGKLIAMGKGVFTVSNLGGFGVEEFTAIINPPESAILAVGAMREAVLVKDGGLRPGRVMTVTLSADHRLIDGLMAARFLRRLKEVLEAPEALREPPR